MDASRTAVVVVGVNLLAVWAAAATGGRVTAPPETGPVRQASVEAAVSDASSDLASATIRLDARARIPRARPGAHRDPFQFGGASGRRGAPARPHAAAAFAPEPDEARPGDRIEAEIEPPVTLEGMAETQEGEGVVRTAILKADGQLVLAGLGARVSGRYEVVALAADAVELEDLVSHTRRTCRLR